MKRTIVLGGKNNFLLEAASFIGKGTVVKEFSGQKRDLITTNHFHSFSAAKTCVENSVVKLTFV